MPLFTPEIAADMARRSHDARKRNEEREQPADADASQADVYRTVRLTRTRKQMRRVDAMLTKATDAKELKALCDALARLAEIERILAGRPLPGALRPGKDRGRRTPPAAYAPIPLAS